jgi:hypothetical protein
MPTCTTSRFDRHDRKNWERGFRWPRGSRGTNQRRSRKPRSEASVIHTKARENRKRDITRGRDYKRSPYSEQHTLESYNLFKGESTSSVMEHIQQGHCCFFRHLDEEFRQNPEVSLCAVRQCGLTLKDVLDEHKYDFEIVLAAVKKNGYALRYADDNLKASPVIVLAAVRKDYMAWSYACKSIRYRTDIHETAYFMVTK